MNNLIPYNMDNVRFKFTAVSRTTLADLFTPVSVYMRLRDTSPQSVLLECSDYHDRANSRSFVCLNPIGGVSVRRGKVERTYPDGTSDTAEISPEYTCDMAINDFLARFGISGDATGCCGLYGYTSFNAVRYFENIEVKDGGADKNDAPDIYYMLFRDVIVFDHFDCKMTIVTLAEEGEDVAGRIDRLMLRLSRGNVNVYPFSRVGGVTSPITDAQHKDNIRRGIAHCMRGDVFQVVLSRRFVQKYEGDDFALYRALRSINPSPYLFYFDFGGFRLLGSSPETHCCIENRRVYIDPIAGTTRRTGDPVADMQAAEALRNDPKENAEHVMLVDLARNDLSRNCHDVHVDLYKDIQYYSHVIHLVSRVSGTLDDGADAVKAFIDTFPAGTLSGAPKVRAMQIISGLEPHCRGAYGGCVGFIGLAGDLNQAITIRTFVSRNGELWMQAGGGIVAASDEELELQEVNNKLGALRKAIEMAEKV